MTHDEKIQTLNAIAALLATQSSPNSPYMGKEINGAWGAKATEIIESITVDKPAPQS